MAAPFRFGLSNHHPYRMAEGAAALLSWSVQQVPGHPLDRLALHAHNVSLTQAFM